LGTYRWHRSYRFNSHFVLAVALVVTMAMPLATPACSHLFHLLALIGCEVLVKVNAESKH
jgi:hypothetical protein